MTKPKKKTKKPAKNQEESKPEKKQKKPETYSLPESTKEVEPPMEEEDEYDELVQDLTSWLDKVTFIDIDLSLPPINFMVFITCLIGQLR